MKFLLLLLCCTAFAQDSSSTQSQAQLPKEEKFLSVQHFLLFNSSAVALATQAGIGCSPSTSSDPMLTHRQCNAQMIAAAGLFTTEVMGAGILHLKKRHGWETLVPLAATAYGTGRAAWSATHRKR